VYQEFKYTMKAKGVACAQILQFLFLNYSVLG